MHQLLTLKFKITLIVILTMCVSYFVSQFTHHGVTVSLCVGAVEGVIVTLLYHSWHLLSRISNTLKPAWMRVDLNGMWCGKINSQHYANQLPIEATLQIKQNWKDVVLSFITAEMTSRTNGIIISFDEELEELHLRYVYTTTPQASATEQNPPQNHGTGLAKIKISEPDKIRITYTNERGPGGDIELTRA